MNTDEAIKEFRLGKKVRRTCWGKDEYISRNCLETFSTYSLILLNDWEIYTEEDYSKNLLISKLRSEKTELESKLDAINLGIIDLLKKLEK